MENDDKLKKLQEFEQCLAMAAENFPPMWKRLHDNLLKEGFDEHKSLRILLVYIHGVAGGRLDLP